MKPLTFASWVKQVERPLCRRFTKEERTQLKGIFEGVQGPSFPKTMSWNQLKKHLVCNEPGPWLDLARKNHPGVKEVWSIPGFKLP